MPVRINYNGEEIASLNGGAIAELKCKDRKMKSDILISVPNLNEGSSSDERVKYVTFMYGATELIKYPVVVGDAVHDPVEKGLIDEPTKESTVSNVYPFGGWNLTDGGEPDPSALQNVTEDRTVYAAFTEEVRYYTVNFYDGDTLVETVQVTYGETANPSYLKEGYALIAWTPSNKNITQDTDCYGEWEEAYKLSDFTWERISELSQSGNGSKFSVGDKKTITYQGIETAVTLVATNHDSVQKGTSTTYHKNSMTFRFDFVCDYTGAIDTSNILQTISFTEWTGGVTVGTGDSSGYLNSSTGMLGKIPTDLNAVIRRTKKTFYNRSTSAADTYINYLFIPLISELGEIKPAVTTEINIGVTPYAFFTSQDTATTNRIMCLQNGTAVDYWVSTAYTKTAQYYMKATGAYGILQKTPSQATSSDKKYYSVYFCI